MLRSASHCEAARIEAAMRTFLTAGGFKAFTTTFEDLHEMAQLPGLAVQRLMGDGFGFGAEGDWKTAALLRAVKVMSAGLPGGTSFMEDYTYHLDPAGKLVLGARMLEVCESIADGRPKLEIHQLGIRRQGRSTPARVQRATRSIAQCHRRRYGQSVSVDCERGGCRRTATAAATPSGCTYCGYPGRILGQPLLPGSSQAAGTIRYSVRRLQRNSWKTMQKWQRLNRCLSMRILLSLN